MKQTAVEWLVDKLMNGEFINSPNELIEQAKAMEKEQSKTDYETGQASTKFKFPLSAEQYYQETYGGKGTEIGGKSFDQYYIQRNT